MPVMSMRMRRSARNLQQLAEPEQPGDDSYGETCRDYDLNYDRAMQKNLMHVIQIT